MSSPTSVKAYGTNGPKDAIAPMSILRRTPLDDDVSIKITHCGVCHSDLHGARNDWGRTVYPLVPGHEIVGIVTAVGPKVTRFKVGDRVGVGCMVDSCRACAACDKGIEQYCDGKTNTYNVPDKHFNGAQRR